MNEAAEGDLNAVPAIYQRIRMVPRVQTTSPAKASPLFGRRNTTQSADFAGENPASGRRCSGENMRRLGAILSFLALTACGYATDKVNSDVSTAKLQSDTARYFGTSSNNVRVGNLKQSVLGTAYRAHIGDVSYDCHYFRKAITCDRSWR